MMVCEGVVQGTVRMVSVEVGGPRHGLGPLLTHHHTKTGAPPSHAIPACTPPLTLPTSFSSPGAQPRV